jgi:hypothetical protein
MCRRLPPVKYVDLVERLRLKAAVTVSVTATVNFNRTVLARAYDGALGSEHSARGLIGDAPLAHERRPALAREWSMVSLRASWLLPHAWRDEQITDSGGADVVIVTERDASVYLAGANELYSWTKPATKPLPVWKIRSVERPTLLARVAALPLCYEPVATAGITLRSKRPSSFLGRETTRVAISYSRDPIESVSQESSTVPHFPGVRDYEWEEDDELGLLLQFAGVVNGHVASRMQVETLTINTDLDENTFHAPHVNGSTKVHNLYHFEE